MLFPMKSSSEVLDEMMNEVQRKIQNADMSEGSIVRTLLEVFNRRLNEAYEYLDIYAAQTFLSTATGESLKKIGAMLGCTKGANETDDNYRYRISRQVFTAANANMTAIRLKCLSVPGVKNVIITPYTNGNGSFTVHVITDEIDTPKSILNEVQNVVMETKAEGVRAIVAKPKAVPIDIRFDIVPRSGFNVSDVTLATQLKESLSDYIDRVPMGGLVSITEMIKIAQQNPGISQAYLNSLSVDGNVVIAEPTYQLEWDSRAYINTVTVVK